jgi:hypothetical protein
LSKLEEANNNFWVQQPFPGIVHGIDLDIGLIPKFLPRVERDDSGMFWPWFYDILELGAGNCNLATQLAALDYIRVHAIDLNPKISDVEKVKDDGLARLTVLSGHQGNATRWGEGVGKESILKLERFDAVVVQALVPSLLSNHGNEWKDMLDVVSMWLAPDKYFYFNDFRAGDYFYSPLAQMVGATEWRRQMKMWETRYLRNQEAFENLGIPKRAFIVGKPGTEGKTLEMGNVKQLRELYGREDCFERFAQHVDPNDTNLHLRRLGFSLVYEKYSGYRSRGLSDLIAPTSMQVWKKTKEFQYDYIAKGLDVTDPGWEIVALDRYHKMKNFCEADSINFFWEALDIVAKNSPPSQRSSVLNLRDQF